MPSFSDWTPDDAPAAFLDVRVQGAWQALAARYDGGQGSLPLKRVFEVVEENGCETVVIERRYIDLDWRSEHSHFYSSTFVRYPSVCHRLHFFKGQVPQDLRDLSGLGDAYLGYSVMRPLESSPVGRTMLRPPASMTGATLCMGTERVDIFGWAFDVSGMPFVSQDAQFLRCAHADMWMVAYLSHLRQGTKRPISADIQEASMGGVVSARQVPSEGLTVFQMLNALTLMGFSPGNTALPKTSAESLAADWRSLYAIVCRYVNSNIPPIIVGNGHVWVVVGYARVKSAGHDRLTLYKHDDSMGPYMAIGDPYNEPHPVHAQWAQALLPLPPKIYLSGERAEASGRWWFSNRAKSLPADDPLRVAVESDHVSYVTYGLRSSEYKQNLINRPSMNSDLAHAYRMSMWPRNIWVIEAQDRALRNSGSPAVLGEVILDPTGNHLDVQTLDPDQHGIISVNATGTQIAHGPDHGVRSEVTFDFQPYETGLTPMS